MELQVHLVGQCASRWIFGFGAAVKTKQPKAKNTMPVEDILDGSLLLALSA